MVTYTKLQTGLWGLRSEGKLSLGDVVTVSKKDGSTEQKTVGAVYTVKNSKTGKTVYLAQIQTDRKAGHSPRRRHGARYCEGWGADNPHAPRPPYTCTECEE